MTYVLACDPSLTAFGWAVFSVGVTPALDDLMECGCVRTAPDGKARHVYQADEDGRRLDEIAEEVLRRLRTWKTALIVAEAAAGSQHANAAKALGMSAGVLRGVAVGYGCRVLTVQAHECRIAAAGSKGASKADVERAMDARFGCVTGPAGVGAKAAAPVREAVADACAVYAAAGRLIEPIRAAVRGAT
jgi:Holliday junction resolvasome RuvABC endonuclease subunit